MKKNINRSHINFFIIVIVIGSFVGCLEQLEIQQTVQSNIVPEDILVVEATITNELKTQLVKLSRARNFANDSTALFENNASVMILDDSGNTFLFEDKGNGNYLSSIPFAAQNEASYQLFISTTKGEEVESDIITSSGESRIDEIYAERTFSDSGVEGMAIYVDSSNPSGELNNYRYNYEETYKIIAPNWTSREIEIIRDEIEVIENDDTGETEILYPDVRLVLRNQEEQVCFNTVFSNEIILSDGTNINGAARNNLIRFINREDAILSHRYSILVRQFLQYPDASEFYRTLLQFSQSENVFSDVQPGFIEGNLTLTNDFNVVVIGFFDVASVTERRLFFNYSDFFPNEDLPPYFGTVSCTRFTTPLLGNPEKDGFIPPGPEGCGGGQTLIELIQQEDVEFYLSTGSPPDECQGPFFVTQRECGDCTAFGSNIIPDFWIE